MTRRAAWLAFALAAACGGEELEVPIRLNLDIATCNTEAPGDISFSCDSAVGVWVRRGDPADPDTSEDACVDFATSGESLAGLPDVLSSSVDLSGLSAGDLWVEMAVYSPGAAADGCPEIVAPYPEQTSIYGRSRVTNVGGTSRGLKVQLFCYAVNDSTPLADCNSRCDEIHTLCPDAFESGPCDLDVDDCYTACGVDDEPCLALCDTEYEACLADQPTPCNDADIICYEECQEDINCQYECDDLYNACIAANCETDYTVCQGRCGAMQDSCATAPAGT
ncbi:MAG TPA: hypothetical protein VFU21_00585 [Kofleriaceae bacterium]|nr:hypothetical protein [Kofleriaceae bacterium]